MKILSTAVAALALACAGTTAALADTWPDKPVTCWCPSRPAAPPT
jgi:ABC-type glycerol-3-phosphate transport system substrate-binding protein